MGHRLVLSTILIAPYNLPAQKGASKFTESGFPVDKLDSICNRHSKTSDRGFYTRVRVRCMQREQIKFKL